MRQKVPQSGIDAPQYLDYEVFTELFAKFGKKFEEHVSGFNEEDKRIVKAFAKLVKKELIETRLSFQEIFSSKDKSLTGFISSGDLIKSLRVDLMIPEGQEMYLFSKFMSTMGRGRIDLSELEKWLICLYSLA